MLTPMSPAPLHPPPCLYPAPLLYHQLPCPCSCPCPYPCPCPNLLPEPPTTYPLPTHPPAPYLPTACHVFPASPPLVLSPFLFHNVQRVLFTSFHLFITFVHEAVLKICITTVKHSLAAFIDADFRVRFYVLFLFNFTVFGDKSLMFRRMTYISIRFFFRGKLELFQYIGGNFPFSLNQFWRGLVFLEFWLLL